MAPTGDPVALLRTRSYLTLLVLAAVIGAPVSAIAYFYLKFVSEAQQFVFQTLPKDWMTSVPAWWPIVPLVLGGLIVGLTLRYLHGTGGHKPAEGFKASGAVDPIDLPGVFIASLATLCLGAVLGPEAPLIAIGSGLGVLAVHLFKKDAPEMAVVVIGAAGSFAAIATLLGSPIVGAFLLMEAAGLGGPLLGVVLVPGLLAAGIGTLIFVGLDSWSGYGTFSLNIGPIPHFGSPTGAELLWAIGIGVVAALLGAAIKRGALALQPVVEGRKLLLTPALGLVVAGLAIVFFEITGKPSSYVLFSGQSALPTLVQHAATWSAGALVVLVLCKGAAYRRVAERVPRRARLSRHVHRGRVRNGPLAPARPSHDRRGGHGHRGDDRRHAGPPVGLRAHGLPAPGGGRNRSHATHHRGGGRVLRRLRTPRRPHRRRRQRRRPSRRPLPPRPDVRPGPEAKGAADRAFVRVRWYSRCPISGNEGPMRTTGTDTGSAVRSAPAVGDGPRTGTRTA